MDTPQKSARPQRCAIRIGQGYDIHRLEAGDGITLGGVFIACDYRIVAHSDGDVLIHALCDALLGAIAGGDIGHLFPDSDPRFAGVDSRRLLAEVMQRVRAAGYAVGNADLCLIAQAPRVAAHVAAMREVLACDLGVTRDCVNVKATTHEGMDAIGRCEGLAAQAVVLLQVAD
jgi:2-C-methyl-D-erythritol 2,4-cyclodiphosphate synthase